MWHTMWQITLFPLLEIPWRGTLVGPCKTRKFDGYNYVWCCPVWYLLSNRNGNIGTCVLVAELALASNLASSQVVTHIYRESNRQYPAPHIRSRGPGGAIRISALCTLGDLGWSKSCNFGGSIALRVMWGWRWTTVRFGSRRLIYVTSSTFACQALLAVQKLVFKWDIRVNERHETSSPPPPIFVDPILW